MCRIFNITTIATTVTIGVNSVVTGGTTVRVIVLTIGMIVVIGGHLPSIATVQPRPIGVATRMCVGATIVIALIEPTITRSSPITGRGASATRHISESKKPRIVRGFFLNEII